jgi:hypothetical protein
VWEHYLQNFVDSSQLFPVIFTILSVMLLLYFIANDKGETTSWRNQISISSTGTTVCRSDLVPPSTLQLATTHIYKWNGIGPPEKYNGR